MKANELRLGNWVYSMQFKENRTVGLIGNGHLLSYEVDNGGLDGAKGIIDAQPIPLTEEWLLKFDFVKKYGNEYFKIGFYYLIKNEYGWWLDDNESSVNNKAILYVHQLQNIYFVLTGEELTVKN